MIAVDSARRSIDETAESHFEVMLRVPIKYRLQLVFRQVRRDRIKADMPESFQFQFCDGIGQYAPWFGEIRRISGTREAVKGLLRSVSSSRMYYCVSKNERVVHSAWITVSHCRHYVIEPNAAVIGPNLVGP